jgi:hypothetical protein
MIPVRRGRAPCVKGVLAAEDDTHHSRPLESPGRAAATLERARRAIEELGKGVPFLIVYYGSDGPGGWQPLDRPLRTVTTLDRFGLVAWQGRTPMLRMLQVDELMAAMGFRGEYSLDGIGQRRDRIRLLGNGVCPPVMTMIVRALTSDASPASPPNGATTFPSTDRLKVVGCCAALLGHASPGTGEKHYNQARMRDASRRYGRAMSDLREALLSTPAAEDEEAER